MGISSELSPLAPYRIALLDLYCSEEYLILGKFYMFSAFIVFYWSNNKARQLE